MMKTERANTSVFQPIAGLVRARVGAEANADAASDGSMTSFLPAPPVPYHTWLYSCQYPISNIQYPISNYIQYSLMPTKLFEITDQPLSQDDILRRVSRPDCGGVVTFAGTVRGSTATEGGERGTDFLEYEAYTEMAEKIMAQIGDEVMQQWPLVRAISILHRIGRCEIEEPTVLIAVATPHRGDGCFEACHYAIERLKAIVPIWKQENWSDGSVWVEGPRQPELE
jgi:molybdopterin synthase catalytic subunit